MIWEILELYMSRNVEVGIIRVSVYWSVKLYLSYMIIDWKLSLPMMLNGLLSVILKFARDLYSVYTEQNYPDRDMDSDLDREILSRVNTRSGSRFR